MTTCAMCKDRQISLYDDWMVCEVCRPNIPKNPLRTIAEKCKNVDEYTDMVVTMIENRELLRPHAKCAIHTIGMCEQEMKKNQPPKKGIEKYMEIKLIPILMESQTVYESNYNSEYLNAIDKLSKTEKECELIKQEKILKEHLEYLSLCQTSIETIKKRITKLTN